MVRKTLSPAKLLKAGSLAGLLLISLFFQGCASPGGSSFTLDVAHINDTHSHLEPVELTLMLDNAPTRVEAGGFPRLESAIEAIRMKEKNVLFLHAGDAVQGTLYFTKYGGKADMDFLDLLGLDVICPGNHEFDKGPALLAGLIGMARFPFVSSSIDSSADPQLSGRIVPYVIKTFGASGRERVGIIGVTTPDTPVLSSPGPAIKFEDPETAVSKTVELLKSKGIDKIIVLSHLGYKQDIALADEVPGIDVIVGGHSHTLLGDKQAFSAIGMTAEGDYPTVTKGPTGETVLIVQAWKWTAVLGELKVTFDKKGRITAWSGRPRLILGETFMRKDAEGRYERVSEGSAGYDAILQVIGSSGVAVVYPEDHEARKKLASYAAPLKTFMSEVVANAAGDMGRGDNSGPGPVVADSMLWKTAELKTRIAILNAGGVRADLAAGAVTVGDIHEVLPFDDTLVVMDLTGAQIRQALEEGVDFMAGRGNDSPYVYVSGISFMIDEASQKGQRIEQLKVKKTDGGYADIDPGTTYRIVTNSFLAGGGDGYEALKKAKGYRLDTGFIDADAFMEYIRSLGALSNPTGIRIVVKKRHGRKKGLHLPEAA